MAVEMFFSEAVKKAFLAFPIGEGDHVVVDEVHQGKPLFMYIAGTLGSTSSEPFGPTFS